MATLELSVTLLDRYGQPFDSLPSVPARFVMFGTHGGNEVRNVDVIRWDAVEGGETHYAVCSGADGEWFVAVHHSPVRFAAGDVLSFDQGCITWLLTPNPIPIDASATLLPIEAKPLLVDRNVPSAWEQGRRMVEWRKKRQTGD